MKLKLSLMAALLLVSLVVAITGCATVMNDVNDDEMSTDTALEKWKCGDYSGGCIFFCPVTLTSDQQLGIGTVKFDDILQSTRFEIEGLDRRWDWCLNQESGTYKCAFTISPDGTGHYYLFTSEEKTSKTRELYKCTKH